MATLRSSDSSIRYNTEAFKALKSLQNNSYFQDRDILTITAFMKTEEEVQAHLDRHVEMLNS